MNQKGVVERTLTKKEAYYVFQSLLDLATNGAHLRHTWPIRWGSEGEEKMIKVILQLCRSGIVCRRQKLWGKKAQQPGFPAAGLRWNVPLNKGAHQVSVIARNGKITVTDSISFQYQTENGQSLQNYCWKNKRGKCALPPMQVNCWMKRACFAWMPPTLSGLVWRVMAN